MNCQVYLSYLEIYNEKIRDLLRPIPGVNLELREDMEQVHVSGLSEIRATSTNEVSTQVAELNPVSLKPTIILKIIVFFLTQNVDG